ncbi:uncharacterized protein [Drosophila pseudoobscura]|uniref:Uncharacterized protein isoform X1 n=1 Tax=Drosophila pseudoobscura pseudoobscura TaxID=46245 RepID=A0A6I8WA25_DROPS|nr:uncharacterized protein LOC26532156 isoform X1 [Drosophila pseudoobscura]
MEKRPKNGKCAKGQKLSRHRDRSGTENHHKKMNRLFNDFYDILENSPLPEDAFETSSREYRHAMLWLNKLIAMQCNTEIDGQIRNVHMTNLSVCIKQQRLDAVFKKTPPVKLEWMEFQDNTIKSQSKDGFEDRMEQTTPCPHTASLTPSDMKIQSFNKPIKEAQHQMVQIRDEHQNLYDSEAYPKQTSMEPFEMRRYCFNQSVGEDEDLQLMGNTRGKGIHFSDPGLSSPLSQVESSSMEYGTSKQTTSEAQHNMEKTINESQQLYDQRPSPPPTSLKPSGIKSYSFNQSIDKDQHTMEENMRERIQFFDPRLSSPSSYVDPRNMEYRPFNQPMGGDQHPMDDPVHEDSSSMQYRANRPSMGGDGDQHLKGDTNGERIKFFYPGVSSPSSHEGSCNIEYKSFNQFIGGSQPHMEQTMDKPQNIYNHPVPSGMRRNSLYQSIGGDQNLKEDTLEEQSQPFDPGLSLTLSNVGPCNMESRALNQFMGGVQPRMEHQGPSPPPNSLDPSGIRHYSYNQSIDEGIPLFHPELSSPSSHAESSRMEYRAFNQSMDGGQHQMEQTMDEPHPFPTTTSLEPSEMRRHSFNQSMGEDEDLQLIENTRGEGIQYSDPGLSSPSSQVESSGMEYRTSNQTMDGAHHYMEQTMDEPKLLHDQIPSSNPNSLDPSGMRRHSLKDSLGGNQHLNEEQSQLFHLGQSLSSSHVDPCNIEHRAFKLSTGGDQHPIENTRAEGIKFFDPKLSTLSPPSPPAGLSSMGHQFDKTTKDAPQIYDSRLPAMRACFIEKPVRGPQNDMQQKLCEIPKIFGTTNVGDQQLFDTKGPSGIEKLSFNQSIGGHQHIKQKIIGAIQQDGKNTKGGSQKFQGPGPSGLGVHLQDSKGRATGESMGVPQNIMQKTIGKPPNYHEKTNGAPRKFKGPRQSGLGQRSLNQSINRPQHLMKKKTMDACLQGDKKTKGGPQNLECRGPSGLEVNIWDSMGHAKGKFMGGSQNLMLKTMVERLKFHEMRKHKPQKVYDPMTPTKGRRHFGCSVCSATSSKCTPEVPTVVEPPFYDVKYPNTARSTYSDGSHYVTPYPSSEEASDSPTPRTKGTEKREDVHKNLREDMLHVLMSVRCELGGEVTFREDDYLEKELARYKAVLIKTKEKKLKKVMRGGDPKAERRYLLENMERDLLSVLK